MREVVTEVPREEEAVGSQGQIDEVVTELRGRIQELEYELVGAPWQGAEYAITVARALFADEGTMEAISRLRDKGALERSEWIEKQIRAQMPGDEPSLVN